MSDKIARWYVETASPIGSWMPGIFDGDEPPIAKVAGVRRIKTASLVGARVRDGTPIQMNRDHERLNVDQAREVYGPDGRFNCLVVR